MTQFVIHAIQDLPLQIATKLASAMWIIVIPAVLLVTHTAKLALQDSGITPNIVLVPAMYRIVLHVMGTTQDFVTNAMPHWDLTLEETNVHAM